MTFDLRPNNEEFLFNCYSSVNQYQFRKYKLTFSIKYKSAFTDILFTVHQIFHIVLFNVALNVSLRYCKQIFNLLFCWRYNLCIYNIICILVHLSGHWDSMEEYTCMIPRDTHDGAFYRAVLALHQDLFSLAQQVLHNKQLMRIIKLTVYKLPLTSLVIL